MTTDNKLDLTSGVTAAQGFLAAGVAAGVKKVGKKDVALVVNAGPRQEAAAVFTTNRFAAAPVIWSRSALANGKLRAVVLNSGGANACTGARGTADAITMAVSVAAELDGCGTDEVAVCSTGLIGDPLPMDKISAGIADAFANLSPQGGTDAALAIMTTDTVSKQAAYRSEAGWTVGGMAKGAGMLAPALATMLVVITTDADIDSADAQAWLKEACWLSFERADSDGCMSTNDTVLLMANAASGVHPEVTEFKAALTAVCQSLAKQLIADAEGAEHSIAVTVRTAASTDDALEVARAIARSNLFKCAIAGNDPNWGRVLSAVGTTKALFDPDKVDVFFNGVGVFIHGNPGAPRNQVDLTGFDVNVEVALNSGSAEATILTNDLTHGYVSENADYSS